MILKQGTGRLYYLNQSINQSNIIYFTVHKCMLKNFQGYLGNKVVFVQIRR